MAESQGKDRSVIVPKPERMIYPFSPGLSTSPWNPPDPAEVGNHVVARLKEAGLPHEPNMILGTVGNLMGAADHPKLVFSPGKGSTSNFQDNVGWKLRLNTGRDVGRPPDDLDDHIMKFLVSQGYGGYQKVKATSDVPAHRKNYELPPGMERMGSFKRGSGGEQWPEQGIFQNYTIYTGPRKETETLAKKLERNFGDYLKDGMSGEEAMFTPHVGARFVYDNRIFDDTYDRSKLVYHNGNTSLGVPLPIHYIFGYGDARWYDPSISMHEAARAHDLLWSILSPDYYGPPIHQQVRKSMKKSRSYEPLRKDLKNFDAREWIGMAAAVAPAAIALANRASSGKVGAALSVGLAASGPVMNMVHGFQVGAGLRDDSESIPEQENGQAFSGDSKVERFFQNTGKVAGKATLMYGRSQSAAAERDAASATAMGRDITDRFRRTPETPAPTIADTPEVSTSPTPRLIRRTRIVSPSTPKATLQPSATPTPPPIYSPPPTLLPDVTAKSWFNVSINPLLRKSEEPLTQEDMANLSLEELRSMSRQPHYDKDRPGRIWAPAGTALFVSPDPEINRRVKVANTLNLMHSLINYQDPNDFVDHEDPSLRSYAKFLLHHVQRDTAAHPIDDSYLESVRDILGEVDHGYEKAALDGLPDKEGIEKHNQALMDTYVEKPAHAAVKRALAAGYSPHQSDAFGDWSQKGVLAHPFPMYTPGTGDDRSGGYTFFPSTHEDFVNAGAEPPPGIGHDSTPTDDTEFFFKSMKKSWFSVSINPALSKKISWGRAIETERPTHEGLFPPQRAELEEVLGSVGLGNLASQYRQHLDEQERRGGAQGNHPLVLMSSDAYRRMLAHNKAAHRARRIPRENERESMGNREGGDGMPYGYDERGGSLGGESFKDSQGRKFLVVRDFNPSEEPHDKGNAVPMSPYVAGNGLIPIGSMHSHPPSAFGSQPSAPDLYIAENGGANSPLNLIMYPYGPETEEPYEGFTAVAGTGNGQPVRGDRDALDASAYGRIAHTRAMYSEIGADKQARISAMDPRNIIVYDARKGGYALTPDEFGRGIHGPSLIPGEHFTAGPQVTESGYLMRNPVGNAGSDLIPRAPGMFGATADDIDPPPSRGTEPADIASRRETAKSWFNVSVLGRQ